MRPPYKIEVFDRDMDYRASTVIPRPDVSFDYLTLERTQISAPRVAVEKGDFIHVTDGGGAVVYQGIVSDVNIERKTLNISAAPLLSLFDLTVSYDRAVLQAGALESFIAGIIRDTFITNADALQNIPGLTVAAPTHTPNTTLNIKSNVHEFYDIITKAFTLYGIVVDVVFLPARKRISVTVQRLDLPPLIIESKLPNVVEKSFVIGDSYGHVNKLVLFNKDDESEVVTYYLHTDGSVDTVDADRITPVFLATEYVESETFPEDAQRRAKETLAPQKYNNLIELTYRADDLLIDPANVEIGQPATVIDDAAYESVLTGYERRGDLVKLIFGNVRVDLTKKLILERRRQP